MKHKMLALILMLTVVSWTQTATQQAPSTDQQTATDKAKCSCCDKMAKTDSKDAHACCMGKHEGQEMASCCSGKDEKSSCGKDGASCVKDGKMAETCCKGKEGMKCDHKASKDCGKRCCGSNKSEKTA